MRSHRFVTLAIVVAMIVSAPSAFARICHPKQPITCGAVTLSQPASPVAHHAKPAVKVAKHSPVSQLAVACGPWIPTFPWCAAATLSDAPQTVASAAPVACGPWIPTFPWCAANTLVSTPPSTPVAKAEPVACGPWIPTFPWCAAKTLG